MIEASQILIVDDDIEICNLLVKLLEQYHFTAFAAKNGEQMRVLISEHNINLIILDLMLPGEDGLTLCRQLRSKSNIPIIMLTAAGDETDKIIGLEIGADDYIAKPFNPRELLARIKAVLRRTHETSVSQIEPENIEFNQNTIEFFGWKLNLTNRNLLSPDEVEITLSTGEYDLLKAFVEKPQQVLSRDQLLDYTHNRQAGPFDRSIDVQVSRLRQKIEADPKNPKLIKTVRGGGYLFTPKVKVVS